MTYIFYIFSRLTLSQLYYLTISNIFDTETIEEIVEQLLKAEIFLDLGVLLSNLGRKTPKIINDLTQKYQPSDEHRNNCQNKSCYQKSKINFYLKVTECENSI